jgi:cell wall-associated NlpC family hydrolase
MGDYVGTVRRSGVIIAMSSGLVASMALPAHAVSATPAEVSGSQTASIPAVPGSGSSAFFASPEGGLLSLPPGLALEDGTVSAPAAAALDFDRTAFVAVPTVTGLDGQSDAKVDLGLSGSRTGSTTRGDQSAETKAPTAPTTRREARKATEAVAEPVAKPAVKAVPKVSSPVKSSSSTGAASTGVAASGVGSRAVALASRFLGTPYRYGGSSPRGFDCSGLIQYVYGQLGYKLPRTAAAQAGAVKRVSRSQARPGDLVLFPGGGHIGLYMGDGMMLDAPHTGTVVQIRKIYSANVSFGRVA